MPVTKASFSRSVNQQEPELSLAVVEPPGLLMLSLGTVDALPLVIEEPTPNVDWNTLQINEM
jgi:hypothetical protein